MATHSAENSGLDDAKAQIFTMTQPSVSSSTLSCRDLGSHHPTGSQPSLWADSSGRPSAQMPSENSSQHTSLASSSTRLGGTSNRYLLSSLAIDANHFRLPAAFFSQYPSLIQPQLQRATRHHLGQCIEEDQGAWPSFTLSGAPERPTSSSMNDTQLIADQGGYCRQSQINFICDILDLVLEELEDIPVPLGGVDSSLSAGIASLEPGFGDGIPRDQSRFAADQSIFFIPPPRLNRVPSPLRSRRLATRARLGQ